MIIELQPDDYEVKGEPKRKKLYERYPVFFQRYSGRFFILSLSVLIYFLFDFIISIMPSLVIMQGSMLPAFFGGLYFESSAWQDWYRFLTYTFLHSGFFHLMMNMIFIQYIGKSLENFLSSIEIFLVFLWSSILAGIGVYIWRVFLLHAPSYHTIGASGGAMGLLGALWMILKTAKNLNVYARVYLQQQIRNLVLLNLIFGLLIPRVDLSIHLAGFLSGGCVAWIFAQLKIKSPLLIRPLSLYRLWMLSLWLCILAIGSASWNLFHVKESSSVERVSPEDIEAENPFPGIHISF